MWNIATHHINADLYSANVKLIQKNGAEGRLTAFTPYNEAFAAPNTPAIRRKLFASYEQLDNKN